MTRSTPPVPLHNPYEHHGAPAGTRLAAGCAGVLVAALGLPALGGTATADLLSGFDLGLDASGGLGLSLGGADSLAGVLGPVPLDLGAGDLLPGTASVVPGSSFSAVDAVPDQAIVQTVLGTGADAVGTAQARATQKRTALPEELAKVGPNTLASAVRDFGANGGELVDLEFSENEEVDEIGDKLVAGATALGVNKVSQVVDAQYPTLAQQNEKFYLDAQSPGIDHKVPKPDSPGLASPFSDTAIALWPAATYAASEAGKAATEVAGVAQPQDNGEYYQKIAIETAAETLGLTAPATIDLVLTEAQRAAADGRVPTSPGQIVGESLVPAAVTAATVGAAKILTTEPPDPDDPLFRTVRAGADVVDDTTQLVIGSPDPQAGAAQNLVTGVGNATEAVTGIVGSAVGEAYAAPVKENWQDLTAAADAIANSGDPDAVPPADPPPTLVSDQAAQAAGVNAADAATAFELTRADDTGDGTLLDSAAKLGANVLDGIGNAAQVPGNALFSLTPDTSLYEELDVPTPQERLGENVQAVGDAVQRSGEALATAVGQLEPTATVLGEWSRGASNDALQSVGSAAVALRDLTACGAVDCPPGLLPDESFPAPDTDGDGDIPGADGAGVTVEVTVDGPPVPEIAPGETIPSGNGTTTTANADGSRTITYDNGDQLTVHPDDAAVEAPIDDLVQEEITVDEFLQGEPAPRL